MKRILYRSLFFFVPLSYGLFLSLFNLSIITSDLVPQNPPGYYDYRGVTHSHSTQSLGSSTPSEVITAAQNTALDFLFITDLNNFGMQGFSSGYHENLLVFSAGKYSYVDSHILFYDTYEKHKELTGLGETQATLADLISTPTDSQTRFLVLAHPFKGGENWIGTYPPGFSGIEVINLKSAWRAAWTQSKFSFLWSVFVYPFNAHLAMFRLYSDPQKEIQLWNQLNQLRPTTGFLGNGTTARTLPFFKGMFRFPSYEDSFLFASNHVLLKSELTGSAQLDRPRLFEALRRGQFYMSIDTLANPKGFLAHIRYQDGEREHSLPLGTRKKWKPGMQLQVLLPEKPNVPFEVIVYRGNQDVLRSNKQNTVFEIKEAGTYRVVVRVIPTLPLPDGKKWIPWIYTNPFFLKP